MIAASSLDHGLARGVKGTYRASEALRKLLEDSGLTYTSGEKTVTVRPRTDGRVPANTPLRVAAADEAPVYADEPQSNSAVPAPPEDSNLEKLAKNHTALDEVVVTGTNIRGIANTAAPVTSYSRSDIDRSGAKSLQTSYSESPKFRRRASEATIGQVSGGGQAGNAVGGTGVNLRGLGNDATLVLVDGHRLAPGNTTATSWTYLSFP